MAEQTIPTHVVIFPFPLQGHMNSMFKLSELHVTYHVTYLITVQYHTRLLLNTNTISWCAKYPGFHFQMLPQNVSHGNAQPIELFLRLYESLKTVKPFLKDMLVGQDQTRPVTCLITDGLIKFTLDVGEETGVPVIYFRTASASSFWAYFCSDKIVEAGDCPFKGLPHYNPASRAIMSSSAYAAAFNSLGLAYKTSKGAPGTGSRSGDVEGGADSSAPGMWLTRSTCPWSRIWTSRKFLKMILLRRRESSPRESLPAEKLLLLTGSFVIRKGRARTGVSSR
ncbi:7-deoxyloganetic acid glucosyl transferase-like isoform X2 [Apium graveolens]|uniref:7-deoxyloganetic acid glucosyl transferase-like isoform X2 n=1 Tax=Apium graveolens TaxID=4045 RepID=UPI003D7BDA4B